MKVAWKGLNKVEVRDVPVEVVSDIPGVRAVGDSIFTMSNDAYAVVAKRQGGAAIPYLPVNEHHVEGLRPYQKDGVDWLATHLQREGGALLADEMGLGKTVQTIKTWDILKRPVLLVCCPASVRLTWAEQFKKWAGVEATLITTTKQAAECSLTKPQVLVTSYELATKLDPLFTPQFVVLDEAQLLAGRGAKRSRGLLALGQGCAYRLALTGTPLWSRPRDLWMLLRILFPNYRFGSADDFDFAYCGASVNKWGGKENKGATRPDELKLRLHYVQLRRTKAEVAKDLPALTRQTRWIPATKEAKKAREAFALRQMSLHEALAACLRGKMDAAVELATELKQFFLVTWQKEHCYALHERLNDEGVPCEVITGDLTHKQRADAVARARANRTGIVATIDSCGTGVDGIQHVASNGIFHAIDYVPIKMAQTEARLHRLGQVLPVTWTYLAMQESADALVTETVVEKLDQWTGLMGQDSTGAMADAFTDADAERLGDEALKAIYEGLGND